MERLRIPFFLLACWLLLLALLIELGSSWAIARMAGEHATPGIAIPALAILDVLLFHSIALMALQLVAPRNLVGRLQGPVTLLLALAGFAFVLAVPVAGAFALLMLMVSLLLAVPFGTIAYLAAWGHFAVHAAAGTLLLLMLFKLGFALLLPLAHQRFLQNKGLIFITAASIGLTWLVGFVQAFVPSFLASIADALIALIIAIVGLIWLILLLIGSLIATIKAIRSLVPIG
ncbi:hypothetical protein ABIC65_003212 [Sphingomonas trueperi]|uniref:hypothetical protein n=1 Tax=Sphingomonas trueperi TaxID=53317 RepID=UPI003395A98A